MLGRNFVHLLRDALQVVFESFQDLEDTRNAGILLEQQVAGLFLPREVGVSLLNRLLQEVDLLTNCGKSIRRA